MAKRVNMNGSQDPFYRYTMPAVAIKVEGTTKMIKTILTNVDDVASACGRPADYLVTYFGQELSANSKLDTKSNKAYVTGNAKIDDLQATCYKFINNYVMCKTCNNPETVVTLSGKKKATTVVLVCKGCGAKSTLDNTDRFVKYMILHPPELTKQELKLMGDISGTKKKKSKEDGAAAAEGEEENGGSNGAAAAATTEGGEGSNGEVAAEKKKKKKKKKVVEEEEDDDDDWCMDTSEEAVKARAQAANVDGMLSAAEKATAALEAKKTKEAVQEATQSISNIEVNDDEVEDIDDI